MDPAALQSRVDDAIRRIQQGEAEAFTTVVRAYQQPLRAWTSRWCAPGIEADDIAHRAFIIAFRQIASYTAGGNCFAWLCAIARNVLRDEVKRLKRRPAGSPMALAELDAAADDLERDDDGGRIAALRECLKRLPADGADLVQRHYAAGEPLAQCAMRLGKTLGAVKSHLHWLRGKLHDCVAAKLHAAPP
jgi:RNA polymerase sigma-70 factor (ECF subfamily)